MFRHIILCIFREAKDKYHILLMESNSYKRSAQNEFRKHNDFLNFLSKLKREQDNFKKNFEIYLDKFNSLNDEYSKLIQMTEFQHQNLDQVILVIIFILIIYKLVNNNNNNCSISIVIILTGSKVYKK